MLSIKIVISFHWIKRKFAVKLIKIISLYAKELNVENFLKKNKKISNKNTRNDHVKQSKCLHAHFFLPSQKITFRSGFVHTYVPKYIRYTHRDKLCHKTVVCLPPTPRKCVPAFRTILSQNCVQESKGGGTNTSSGNRMQRDLVRETVGIRARFVIKKKFGCRPII